MPALSYASVADPRLMPCVHVLRPHARLAHGIRPPHGHLVSTSSSIPSPGVEQCARSVEGAELIVLQTMDWSIPVLVWTIELDGSNPTKDRAVRALLRSKGYTFFARHKINDIFVRNKKLALGRAEQCKKCATRCASA